MYRLLSLIFIFFYLMLGPATAAGAQKHAPSKGAVEMKGAKGTFSYFPPDHKGFQGKITWWKDTDGVSPSAAGCHIGYKDNKGGRRNGRVFGEACTRDGLYQSALIRTHGPIFSVRGT